MIDFSNPLWRRTVPAVLSLIALLLALVIVVKAIRGYRQNNDRGMFLLAIGLFLVFLAPIPVELSATLFFDETIEGTVVMTILQQLFRVAGMVVILASMYVRR